MEPSMVRDTILRRIKPHEAIDSASYVDDTDIAATLCVELADVQLQLLILENHQLVELLKMFGPEYSARLTAKGMEVLETARQQAPSEPRVIGF